ncbi:MAG: hypothetical protein AAGN66_02760 [Acidobacteriota bacterium]
MPLLDAALAFTLTMLGTATVVTMLITFGHKVLGLRRSGLKRLLKEFFEKEAQPVVAGELSRLLQRGSQDVGARAKTLARDLRGQSGGWLSEKELEHLTEGIDVHKLTRLGAEDLVAEMRKSKKGQELMEQLGARADLVFDGVARHWERIGKRATEQFRRSSRLWSTVVAVAVAFAFNVDSLYLLEVYMSDADARAAVVGQQAAILDQAQAGDDPGDGEPADTMANFAQLQQQSRAFQNADFPIGWQLFPNCPPTSVDFRCIAHWQRAERTLDVSAVSFERREALNPAAPFLGALGIEEPRSAPQKAAGADGRVSWADLASWLAGCVLTGLLAGLGAPFWYDIVVGIAASAQKLGSGGSKGHQPPAQPLPPPPEMPEPASASTSDSEADKGDG